MNRHHPPNRDLLKIVHSMDDIEDGRELAEILNESSYVAIKDGDVIGIADKCGMTRYREFITSEEFMPTFGLEKFGYKTVIGMKPINAGYVLVGPASSRGFTIPIESICKLLDVMTSREHAGKSSININSFLLSGMLGLQ
jgi:hypothetical protein